MRTTLGRTIAFFLERHGVDLSVYDRSFLLKLLEARQARLGLRSAPSYLKHLEENALEAEELLQSTQVIYSEFFRNPLTFALLETLVLPCLVTRGEQAGHGEIRIWSTACAAGQEIYSTAMLLHDLFQVRGREVPCRIFGTDRSEEQLAMAREGLYDAASLRNVPYRFIRRHFAPLGDRFEIDSRLKERIDFSRHDLLHEPTICPAVSIYGHFDLIFCSNILLYYNADVQQLILNNMHSCLTGQGFLVVDESEKAIVGKKKQFRETAALSAIFVKQDKDHRP